MKPRPPQDGPVQPDPETRFSTLEQRYGPLRRVTSGMQSRVYTTGDRRLIVKIYRNQRGDHRLEANNMRLAGMAEWVVDAVDADGVEALILRRFDGHPLRAADIPAALPGLRARLARLHAPRPGSPAVNVAKVAVRLQRFRSALAAYPLEDLFEAVERPLDEGRLAGPAAFCHLDLWHGNILYGGGEVLLIDWTKAGWDDPLRDLALLKTGSLDLLGADESLAAALSVLPDRRPETLSRYRAYLALTTLHDLYWFLMNEPYEFEDQKRVKVPRARHALARLPE